MRTLRVTLLLWVTVLVASLVPSVGEAQAYDHALRLEAGLGLPVGSPVAERFDAGGGLGLGYELRFLPFLGAEAHHGSFFFPTTTPTPSGYGAYHGLGLGLRLHPIPDLDAGDLYAAARGAIVFTGDVVRPGLEVDVGFEFALSSSFRFGPFIRYAHAFQTDGAELALGQGDGTFLIIGLSGALTFGGEEAAPVDTDRDGSNDDVDRCPNEPEDVDGYEDEDGCPDTDDDADGVPDADDSCPREAEDRDGFQDEDGCPDPDNDGDGIADGDDQCPNEAEDMNGQADEDGCPDAGEDSDGDGSRAWCSRSRCRALGGCAGWATSAARCESSCMRGAISAGTTTTRRAVISRAPAGSAPRGLAARSPTPTTRARRTRRSRRTRTSTWSCSTSPSTCPRSACSPRGASRRRRASACRGSRSSRTCAARAGSFR